MPITYILRLRTASTAKPVEVVGLRDPDEQLSYCIKFVTYHQPGRFEDFLFAYGARRRGGRLVVDK